MQESDGRKLSDEVLEALRQRAVVMHGQGMTNKAIGLALGVHAYTVGGWLKLRRTGGDAALKAKKRGRRPGEQKLLDAAQEREIALAIRDHCPDQLKLPFALWTREAVLDLIRSRFGVEIALRTITDYLKRWGYTAQRPVKRAIERQDARIKAWLEEDYPAIAARARKEGAEIQWCDETGVSNLASYGRSFAPKGRTPVIERPARRQTTSMISTVTNRGSTRFMVYDGALNVELFLSFLRRLIKQAVRKIFLVLDNLKVHHANKVKAWAERHKQRIELVFLPPYAPEHNPDELLNSEVKRSLAKRPPARNKPDLKRSLRSLMHSLQKQPERIRAFFRAKTTAYAA